jgi:4-amino-4-deoxy-L-arabinose transferase-like glycosyltransferase
MKMIGVNELAVRLPSAFAASFTCLTILIFSLCYLKQFWFGFIAIIVLITSHGYINVHATRTGDYDALLTLFTTLSGLLFFVFLETKKNKYLYLFFLSISLAVLTKGITGCLFLPALVIYSLWIKQFLYILKNKHFYIGLFGFLVLTIGYYLLRENYNTGYIAAVQENELGGRYLDVIENHKHGFWFYYDNFIDFQLSVWYLLVPCGLLIGLVNKDRKINRITLFSLVMISTFFIVISTAQTKLEWYDVPLYPFLSILIAIFIYYIFDLLQNFDWIKHTLKNNIAPFIFLFLIAISPYKKILDKTYLPKEYSWDKDFYEIGYFLKDAVNGKYDLNNYYLLHKNHNTHILFYLNILNAQGINISFKNWEELSINDYVISHQKEVIDYIETHYTYEILTKERNLVFYKINGVLKI